MIEETIVWPPGQEPWHPEPWTGRGQRSKLLRRSEEHHPVSVRELAATLPVGLYETVRWRIERDFRELKDEIGLEHFEGRRL